MEKINEMEGHYIVSGCSKDNRNIALKLFDTDRQFMITDLNEKVLKNLY